MCGYIRRFGGGYRVRQYLKQFGLDDIWDDQQPDVPEMKHFYPAWGGAVERKIENVIICENGANKTVDATWWYDCKEEEGRLFTLPTRSFNARNLELKLWREPIRKRRAIVVGTGLGESKEEDLKDGTKRKHQFLMEGEEPFLMGALYKAFPHHLYSTAIITRNTHPEFRRFHDKAFPLFLPNDKDFIDLWLSDEPETHPDIQHLLHHPQIFTDLNVIEVKTFKDGVPKKDAELEVLPKDLVVA